MRVWRRNRLLMKTFAAGPMRPVASIAKGTKMSSWSSLVSAYLVRFAFSLWMLAALVVTWALYGGEVRVAHAGLETVTSMT